MAEPYEDEVATISGIDANGLVAAYSYATWRDFQPYPSVPPQYAGTADVFKWGNATPGTGATITYYFDPAASWTADEQWAFQSTMALWSAVANVRMVATADPSAADFWIKRGLGTQGANWENIAFTHPDVGSGTVGSLAPSSDNRVLVDTNDPSFGPLGPNLQASGGYPISTLIHEFGHMLGLGHGGPYDFTDIPGTSPPEKVNPATQQTSPYDMKLWTIMSYIMPHETANYSNDYPVKGTDWGSFTDANGTWYYQPLTPMMLDILAIQRLYGVATGGPLASGGLVFGFNTNVDDSISIFYDFTRNTHPVVTLWSGGTGNTLDLSGFSENAVIDLNPGTFSSAGGMKNNIGIAFGTVIEKGIGGSGDDHITASDVASILIGNAGNDTLVGGAGSDQLFGGAGNDVLTGGAAPDTFDPGGGLNVLRDTLANMNGDTVFNFGQSTTIDVQGVLMSRTALTITQFGGDTTLGLGDTQILLKGVFSGGDFVNVLRNGEQTHTMITFNPFLPNLYEGIAVNPNAVNGVANQAFFTGDGNVQFRATLDAAISHFANTLGYYKVGTDGLIFDVEVIYANTLAVPFDRLTVDLGAPGDGVQLGFFLIQNGFNQFGTLPDDLSFINPVTGAQAHLGDGMPLLLSSAAGGVISGAGLFHSFANLNTDGAYQVLSGTEPGGRVLKIGFEDVAFGTGDNDFQDVVLSLRVNNDGYFFT